jgi:ribokinase
VNEPEAAELAGVAQPSDVDSWSALAARLGARACVITLGSQGAVAYDGRRSWWQPAFGVSVVDTTGAGDAFCGTLAASFAAGDDLAEAVRRGCAAGALATGHLGAQSSLPTAAELDAFLQDAFPRAEGR